MQPKALRFLLIIAGTAMLAGAQEGSVRSVGNPYQEGVPYSVGDDLTPDVEIDGARWTLVRIAPNAAKNPKPGRDTPVVADLRFDNRSERSARLSVVLMLEDEDGNQLERLKFPGLKLAANRVKEFQYKFTVPGDDLLATRRVYLFCQVD